MRLSLKKKQKTEMRLNYTSLQVHTPPQSDTVKIEIDIGIGRAPNEPIVYQRAQLSSYLFGER